MAKFLEATPITLMPPTAGVNRKDPLANMGQAYSPWLLNVDCLPTSIKVRNGYVIHSTVGASSLDIMALCTWGSKSDPGNNKLFAYCNDGTGTHKIYDISVSAESLAYTLADNDATFAFPTYFSRRSGFAVNLDAADCGAKFDGTTWSAWGFTYGGSPALGINTVSYKGRVYVLYGTGLYWGALEAITGAMSLTQFEGYIDKGTRLTWIAVLPSPGNRISEVYIAFGSDEGEISVYAGDYPDSATWGLIGKFNISASLGYQSIINYKNDVWILTDTGVVNLRVLFVNDQAALEETISKNIDPYFTSLVAQLNQSFWQTIPIGGVFWPERNQILILLPGHIDKDGTFSSSVATMCIYNTISRAWSFHKLSNVDTARLGGLTYYKGGIYFYTQNVVMKVDTTLYKDETWNSPSTYAAIPYEIQGAYSSFGNEGILKKIVGLQPITKTDFAGTSIGMQSAADFGRQISDIGYVELIDGYNTAIYPGGAEGIYLQYRMQGNSDITSVDGLELFGVGMHIIQGGRG